LNSQELCVTSQIPRGICFDMFEAVSFCYSCPKLCEIISNPYNYFVRIPFSFILQ
jgi:hypothetical protein